MDIDIGIEKGGLNSVADYVHTICCAVGTQRFGRAYYTCTRDLVCLTKPPCGSLFLE